MLSMRRTGQMFLVDDLWNELKDLRSDLTRLVEDIQVQRDELCVPQSNLPEAWKLIERDDYLYKFKDEVQTTATASGWQNRSRQITYIRKACLGMGRTKQRVETVCLLFLGGNEDRHESGLSSRASSWNETGGCVGSHGRDNATYSHNRSTGSPRNMKSSVGSFLAADFDEWLL